MKQLLLGVAILVLAAAGTARAGASDGYTYKTFNGTTQFDATKASLRMHEQWSEIGLRHSSGGLSSPIRSGYGSTLPAVRLYYNPYTGNFYYAPAYPYYPGSYSPHSFGR